MTAEAGEIFSILFMSIMLRVLVTCLRMKVRERKTPHRKHHRKYEGLRDNQACHSRSGSFTPFEIGLSLSELILE